MKTILIDDDLYSHLVGHTQVIGESASSILRRLLGLDRGMGTVQMSDEELGKVFGFMKNWEQYRHLTQAKKFLHILSWVHSRHPNEFEKVLAIEGNRRKYFARDEKVLLNSGSSTNPRPIPDSDFWVITNNSTAKKAEILADVFRLFGYEQEHVQALLSKF